MRSFSEISKEKQFSEDYYPYSEQGIKLATQFYLNLERSILFLIITIIFKVITSYLTIDQSKLKEADKLLHSMKFSSKNVSISEMLQYIGSIATKWIMIVNLAIFILFITITFIILIVYIINIVRRQRNYERSVIKNDLKAFYLKRKILGSKNAKSVLRDKKRALQKKKEGDNRLTIEDKIPVLVQKEFMKMIVMINSRESLDSKGYVDTQYRIIFNTPHDNDIAEKLDKEIEGINVLASRLVKAKVKFGKKFDSDDYSFVVFRAWDQQKDKYLREDDQSDEEQEEITYEYSYPLSMLNDQQDKIDKKREIADQWTKRNISTIKAFLSTSKIDCSFKRYEVGNSMASYIFVMADDVSLPHFDKLGDTLDNMMKRKGSAVALEEGNLIVSVPLVDEAKIPLNVPTMYRELFG